MKLKLFTILGLAILKANAGTSVSVSNFSLSSDPQIVLPIVDNAGIPISAATTTIQIGTFTDRFADRLPTLSHWTDTQIVINAFNPSGPVGAFAFDGLFSVDLETDESGDLGDATVDNGAYAFITYTAYPGADLQILVFNLGKPFPKQEDGTAELALSHPLGFYDLAFGGSTFPVYADTSHLPVPFQSFDAGLGISPLTDFPKPAIPDLNVTHDGNILSLSWIGEFGVSYQIEYSDDLENWFSDLPGSTFNGFFNSEPLTFTDDSGASRRYYRLIQP